MILITGSAGYIGSELCKKFSILKIDYIGIDNFSNTHKINIFDKKKIIKCCISNSKKILFIIKKFKIKIIIHAAAFSYVSESEINKRKYYLNNVLKTKKFILTVAKYNIKQFIFLSSSNVYFGSNKKKFFETDKISPKNYYGKTKKIIEEFLFKKRNSFSNSIILRLFNIIGLTKKFKPKNFRNFKYQRLLFKIYFSIINKIPITLNCYKKFNKLTFPSRDFLDIDDLTNLISKLIKSQQKKNYTVFNVGKEKSYSLDIIIRIIKKKFKHRKLFILHNKLPFTEYQTTLASIKKIKSIINWTPRISLEKSIKSYDKYLDF